MNATTPRHSAPRWRAPLAIPLIPVLALSLLALFSHVTTVSGGEQRITDMPRQMRVGFLQRVFYEIDVRDARAALEVNMREVSRTIGLTTQPQLIMYSDMASMTAALHHNELELVTMPAVEYLRLRNKIPLIPSFVSANNNGLGSRYVLIVRKDGGITSFNDLKGRTLLLPPIARHDLGHLWLEVLLMKATGIPHPVFFRQLRESPKITSSIMGVFFRQADAAMVTRAGLDIAKQLNPQLDRQLTVLAESRNLCDGITCFIPSTSESFRDSLTKAFLRLNGTRTGQQLFTLFQSSGVTPFKTTQLEGLEELLHEHERLKAKVTKRK